MKNLRNWSRVAALLLILFGSTICVSISAFSVTPVPPIVPASGTFEKFGPRVDRLTFKVYGYSRWLECTELEQGKIDALDVPVPRHLWEDWLADPEITMGEYTESSVVYFALNNARWPLGHGNQKPAGLYWDHFGGEIAYTDNHKLSLWPKYLESSAVDTGGTSDTYFFDPNCQRCLDARQYRRALAHLVNRDSIVAHMGGIAMESLVFPAIKEDWENPNIPKYPFNLTQAVETLKNGGFQDYDGDGWVEYSPSHAPGWNPGDASPADMEELPSIEVYVGIDDPDRIHAATLLCQMMNYIGIPNTPIITTPSICSLKVWQEYDYDIYPEYSDLGAPNPTIYFEGFHSSRDLYPDPWADNYVHYHSHAFDTYAEDFFTAPTIAEAQSALFEAQAIFHENAVVIPLYTYEGYVAHRTRYGRDFPRRVTVRGQELDRVCQ